MRRHLDGQRAWSQRLVRLLSPAFDTCDTADLGRWPTCAGKRKRWNKSFHPAGMSRVVRRLGFSRQKARQVHPQKGLQTAVDVASVHPDKRITLWFQDGRAQVTLDRIGQKGRICRRWWLKGQRPPGLCDRRFERACLLAAVLAPGEHAVMVLDQAGWHGARALRVPDNVSLVPLPPCAPDP